MKKKTVAVHWFGQDLRLHDNPALTLAAADGHVLPVYIIDEENADIPATGSAGCWWLHHSLTALDRSLGGKLSVYQGNPAAVFDAISTRFNIKAVFRNRIFEPRQADRDRKTADHLVMRGINPVCKNGSLLWNPQAVMKPDGTPYRVFTPFYRKGCLQAAPPRKPLPPPAGVQYHRDETGSVRAHETGLLPQTPRDAGLAAHWQPGEDGARTRLEKFLDRGLSGYAAGRDFPSQTHVSGLSPHLRFGEISPNSVWYAVRNTGDGKDTDSLCSELGWREFCYSLLCHNPDMPVKNLRKKFDAFPWTQDPSLLEAWKKGLTGIPLVDAGMRELLRTGYMHNRVRMITASFLVKNLRIHWHHGERWFYDMLVDADTACNSANWQWVAGCGADAAPYFRIFNPVTQATKFDPDGSYIRKYVPEIASLPDRYLFSPWEAPASVSGRTGTSYPEPVADPKKSRKAALAAFRSLEPQ